MIMEFVNGGELFYHLSVSGKFKEERAKFYCAEIILALEYLHREGIVYRDLKPENILVDAEGHCKLTDFGLSKDGMDEKGGGGMTESFCGTTEYLAPEIIRDKQYNSSVDWYSLGVVMYEMVTGNNPFKANRDKPLVTQMNHILTHEWKLPKFLTAECADLILRLTEKEVSFLKHLCKLKNVAWEENLLRWSRH